MDTRKSGASKARIAPPLPRPRRPLRGARGLPPRVDDRGIPDLPRTCQPDWTKPRKAAWRRELRALRPLPNPPMSPMRSRIAPSSPDDSRAFSPGRRCPEGADEGLRLRLASPGDEAHAGAGPLIRPYRPPSPAGEGRRTPTPSRDALYTFGDPTRSGLPGHDAPAVVRGFAWVGDGPGRGDGRASGLPTREASRGWRRARSWRRSRPASPRRSSPTASRRRPAWTSRPTAGCSSPSSMAASTSSKTAGSCPRRS